MPEFYQSELVLPAVKRRKIRLTFDGSNVTSDAGVHLLRLADRRMGLTDSLAKLLPDDRVQGRCRHTLRELLRQRLYGLALGYEDLNDSAVLREDLALQAAVENISPLASAPTLCRLEQGANRQTAATIHEVLFQQFIGSYQKAPKRLILDLDATDNPVYGMQEGRYFQRHYNHHCFLPLYVFSGRQLLVSYLRPADRGAAHHAPAIVKLLVTQIRRQWPNVQIIIRGDSGYCIPRLLNWCDRHRVDYVIGMTKNCRLLNHSQEVREKAANRYGLTGKKQREFDDFLYRAHSWPHARRMIVKAEHGAKGSNPRFVVTTLPHTARHLYTRLYCARGDMENRIKEQIQLFSSRTSCHRWWPNQLRLLLSGLAYVLVEHVRGFALQGTVLASAYASTIRLKLFKVGAVVINKASSLDFRLSSNYPYAPLFHLAVRRLLSG